MMFTQELDVEPVPSTGTLDRIEVGVPVEVSVPTVDSVSRVWVMRSDNSSGLDELMAKLGLQSEKGNPPVVKNPLVGSLYTAR